MTPEQLKLLKEVRDILYPSMCHDLMYRTPVMALRQRADRIEYEEKIKHQFDREIYFWEHGEYPPEVGCTTNLTDGGGTFTTDGSNEVNLTNLNKI